MDNIITNLKNFQKFNNLPFHIDIISPTKSLPLHYHDCVELLFVKSGSVINYADSFPFNHGKGNLFLISGQVSHAMLDFKKFSAYRVLFDMSIFDELDDELKNSPAFISLFAMSNLGVINNSYHSVISLNESYTKRLTRIFDELLCAYEAGGTMSEEYIKLLFYLAVSLISNHFNEKNHYNQFHSFTRLYGFIMNNLNDHISVSEFADKLRMSRVHLHKLFVKHYGKTPIQFMMDMRIRQAKALLTLTDKSITEIATSCGFENPVYFTEVFKSRESVPPSAYRKNIKSGEL